MNPLYRQLIRSSVLGTLALAAMLFIPAGCAHGFLALEDDSMMVYQTSTVHSPSHDAGVLWNSFGFDWPAKNPILSERDQKFPALCDFQSPF